MTTTTRCLFICEAVDLDPDNHDRAEVELSASTEKTHPDHPFWRFTPGGTLRLQLDAPDAYKRFEAGRSYYVDLTPADTSDH